MQYPRISVPISFRDFRMKRQVLMPMVVTSLRMADTGGQARPLHPPILEGGGGFRRRQESKVISVTGRGGL
jgi:hypothetical protein